MKLTHLILSFLWAGLVGCLTEKPTQNSIPAAEQPGFRVASYNIRYNPQADIDSGNGWEVRKKPLTELIIRNEFDLIATQEGDSDQLADLLDLLPGFDYVGYGYGAKDGHICATFYKKDLFTVLDQGVFWYSETPDIPSLGWDATDRRVCTWTKFEEKSSGKEFFVFNSHFYWRYETAKKGSGPLLAKKIKEIAKDAPVIAMGDLNSTSNTSQIQAVKELLADAYEITETPRQGVENTNMGGGVFQGNPVNRIDYIFVSPHFKVKDYKVISETYANNRYPSDHLPVTSRLSF